MIHTQPEQSGAIDVITAFMPGLPPAEHGLRTRLMKVRNVAAMAVAGPLPVSGTRDLFVMLDEVASAWWLRPASISELEDAIELCQTLWRATRISEKLEALA